MIVVRAPLRLSFVGGGTDQPGFYKRAPGRVVSTTIDKFVYLVINRTPLIKKVSARYSASETVNHPSELQHTRIRAALTDLGIESGIEVGSFASLPAKTGLGSSSSFTVALLKGLHAFKGSKLDSREVAEAASRLEMELIQEPIGKQDQYAAAFGGFNMFQFNADNSVEVTSMFLSYKNHLGLEQHLLLFFTGLTRAASSVLTEQREKLDAKFETYRTMADSVSEFAERLAAADFKGLGGMLHDGWQKKKSLASGVSSSVIDRLYDAGMNAGAWGGKVAGAGGGGCVMFLASPETHTTIRASVAKVAHENNLQDFQEIPVHFSKSGAEILYNGDWAVHLG
ncbi:MAG: GHMP kinase [Patescibacteria group bacterium]|nr:GHMP kinase [Patescibacteria group bacterium]